MDERNVGRMKWWFCIKIFFQYSNYYEINELSAYFNYVLLQNDIPMLTCRWLLTLIPGHL
jgi:hypothetical protein